MILHVLRQHPLEHPSQAEATLWQWASFLEGKLRALPTTEAIVLSGTLRCWSESVLMVAEFEIGARRPVGCAAPQIAADVLRRLGWSVGRGPARVPSAVYRELEIRPGHPVVFIGCHGVLIPNGGEGDLSTDAIRLVSELCAATGARLVFTSYIRRWGLEQCAAYLQSAGLPEGLLVGTTPWLDQASRGEEIARWLADNLARPYVVVDTCAEAGLGHHGHVVLAGVDGLTPELVDAAAGILRGQA